MKYAHPIERMTALIRFYWLVRTGLPVRRAWARRQDGIAGFERAVINRRFPRTVRLFDRCQDLVFSDRAMRRWEARAEFVCDLRQEAWLSGKVEHQGDYRLTLVDHLRILQVRG